MDRRGISFRSTLEELNLDGTPTNSGCEEGLAALTEEELGREVQRSFCFLHHLDRPLLHLIMTLDGKTLGPEAWSGPLGKQFTKDVHLLPVTDFQPIHVDDVSLLKLYTKLYFYRPTYLYLSLSRSQEVVQNQF